MKSRINMADVAREAGVSTMTVSRAINGKDGISEETRERILAIIEKMGYSPSLIARSLVTNKTFTIGLVVPDNNNPFFSDIAYSVEQVAYENNYNVFLCNTHEDTGRELKVIDSLAQNRVDGIILCSSRLDDDALQKAIEPHKNIVLFNRDLDTKREIGLVDINNEKGGYLATSHLIKCGYHNIACLMGPAHSRGGQKRTEGYHQAMEEADLTVSGQWTLHCEPTIKGGYKASMSLLQEDSTIEALFCYNDLVAIGVIQACNELGIRIPEDFGLAGFDNISLATIVTPALTSCAISQSTIGESLTSILLSLIDDSDDIERSIMIEPELIIRDSTPES